MDLHTCRLCSREYHYDRKQGHQVTICNSCNANRMRRAKKQKCVTYKGGKCQNCGYNKSLRALGFHHRDRSKKKFTIATKMCWAWSRLKKELDKCDLLCANCHMEEE